MRVSLAQNQHSQSPSGTSSAEPAAQRHMAHGHSMQRCSSHNCAQQGVSGQASPGAPLEHSHVSDQKEAVARLGRARGCSHHRPTDCGLHTHSIRRTPGGTPPGSPRSRSGLPPTWTSGEAGWQDLVCNCMARVGCAHECCCCCSSTCGPGSPPACPAALLVVVFVNSKTLLLQLHGVQLGGVRGPVHPATHGKAPACGNRRVRSDQPIRCTHLRPPGLVPRIFGWCSNSWVVFYQPPSLSIHKTINVKVIDVSMPASDVLTTAGHRHCIPACNGVQFQYPRAGGVYLYLI